MLIDSHVNLHAPQFADDAEDVIARARAAGVQRMITICDRVSSFAAVSAVAEAHADIWCSVGTHPHEAKENPDLTPQDLIQLAVWDKVVGIGETGLDFLLRPVAACGSGGHIPRPHRRRARDRPAVDRAPAATPTT